MSICSIYDGSYWQIHMTKPLNLVNANSTLTSQVYRLIGTFKIVFIDETGRFCDGNLEKRRTLSATVRGELRRKILSIHLIDSKKSFSKSTEKLHFSKQILRYFRPTEFYLWLHLDAYY